MADIYITLDNLSKAMSRYDKTFKLYTDDRIVSFLKAIAYDDEENKIKIYDVPAPVPAGTIPIVEIPIAPADAGKVYVEGDGIIISSDAEISINIDEANKHGLAIGENGLMLQLATAPNPDEGIVGNAGAMSAEDKARLDSLKIATESEVKALFGN